MARFEPITVASIKQGEFLKNLEDAFQEAQDRIIEHVGQHGLTAEAVVVAKVKIKFNAPATSKGSGNEMPVFGIASEVQVQAPKKPVQYSNSFQTEDQTGRKCLFTPAGGSATGNPKQETMLDSAGRPIAT